MASIEVPVDETKLLAYLQEKHGLQLGDGRVEEEAFTIRMRPPVTNSNISHIVDVTVRFHLQLGEINELINP